MRISAAKGERASGVTRKKPRNGRQCRRCHRFGTFGPDSLVCDACLGTLPLNFDVTITVTVVGGGWG